ncbi:DUF4352 domain-containing protein [Pseudonocardia sp. Ae505_Ps2]|uniref:DUF4352 domain-containing protein n=1 Tax=Pseudonocardia sp. Ae505_Ps2 TaxID=1885034 RepID=UPI0009661DFD|nr:DUF4352 domain-containing protein [Pseudonocardia sp. Ae505_Ps2]OLM14160.1 hypothetical protein Ae505Ps2_4290c [Pseudonocardia sp. Ae505_Ps2]OLM14163.1 hypothetical protein Ae505Ps2_4293c [Pseudonocardia sp. Ae505_Ps2]
MRNPTRSVVAAAVAAAAAGLLSSCAADSTTPTAAPAPSVASAPSDAPAPSNASAPSDASAPSVPSPGGPPPELGPTTQARLDSPTNLGGLEVTVTSIRPVQLVAEGPGELAGPGAAVTIRLTNRTPKPVDGGLDVNARYADKAASANSGPPSKPAGTLEPGASTDATYAFLVPADQVDQLKLSITSTNAPDIVVITR